MPDTHINRYEVEKTLGRGAMGIVYLARDPLIDRKVALKTLRLDVGVDVADEFRERFLREAQAAGRLNHPGIVTIHDVGEDRSSGVLYIAMEYVEGRDLKQIMATGHRFRPSEAARIVADVAVALNYAHQMGVVHRDIKPGNLILTNDGTVKIADFGIARMESSNLTVDGQFIGTPNFMSPEQISGLKLDGRSDLFSLGVVLFTLLTGQRPYSAGTMHQVTRMILEDPPPIPSVVDEDVPAAFNPIVVKLLDKDPDKRFQTGAELATVLAALARSLVRREPGDEHRTSIQSPDLGTRADGDLPKIRVPDNRAPHAAPLGDLWRRFRDRIVLPEPLTWEVMPSYAWVIIGVWGFLWLAVAGFLWSQRPPEPFAAPSAGATRNLNRVVSAIQSGRAALESDRLDEARSASRMALDQAPASPAARALVAEVQRRIEIERTSASTQARVSELVAEGRNAYRSGSYVAAAEIFREALSLDPQSELASDYLGLAEDRSRHVRRRTTNTIPGQPTTREDLTLTRVGVPAIEQTAGNARITLYYICPINAGSITIAVDGEAISEIPFDHTKKGFLGIKTEGKGTIKRVVLAPSGARTIDVTLTDRKRGVIGSTTFRETLPTDSEWTIRITQPKSSVDPVFSLIRTSR